MILKEMTNEELAGAIENGCGTSLMGRSIREAAARLRNPHGNCRIVIDALKAENADLRAKLKVAEEALAAIREGKGESYGSGCGCGDGSGDE